MVLGAGFRQLMIGLKSLMMDCDEKQMAEFLKKRLKASQNFKIFQTIFF